MPFVKPAEPPVALQLFYRDHWPARFTKRYIKALEAENSREKAKVACEVIDDFINTNGWVESSQHALGDEDCDCGNCLEE